MTEPLTSKQIRDRFTKFFQSKGHTIVPSAPLVPENDPTVLFNTAGMQPLVPYLMGRVHPAGDRIANIQKCVRTNDIDEVGDNTHLTFFEMTGNWSLGSYFKREAINYSYELITNKETGFGLDPQRLYITCFEGDDQVPRDDESANTWKELFEKNSVTGERIFFFGASANWWPAVKGTDTWTGPTGPCSEMFYDVTGKLDKGLTKEQYITADDKQQVVEIGNDVFMEYKKENGKIVGKLEKKNVDDGRGFERTVMVIQGKENVFETDLFVPILEKIKSISKYYDERRARIIADHIRTSVMLISDEVLPSNSDQGYILRRLLRRAINHSNWMMMPEQGSLVQIAEVVIDNYKDIYRNVGENSEQIKKEINEEENKFRVTLRNGLKEFEKGTSPFILFTTFGFPFELTMELAKERGRTIDEEKFKNDLEEHQKLSRVGAEHKFKGGLGDTSEKSVEYHTATHLLHQALRDVLGDHVSQKGSNITPERLRFDFTHHTKMTDEEKKKVEEIVNEKIKSAIPVQVVSLSKDEAEKSGALHFFGDKYGDTVTVYYIGDQIADAYSKEFCGGPHVSNTSDLKGVFKISKEEAVSAGVRRIKAVLG